MYYSDRHTIFVCLRPSRMADFLAVAMTLLSHTWTISMEHPTLIFTDHTQSFGTFGISSIETITDLSF